MTRFLITGVNRGIGAALHAQAVALGHQVIGTTRDGRGGTVPLVLDTPETIAEQLSGVGPLDILINNAGVIEPVSSMMNSDPDAWGHVIDINLKGVYYGMRAAMPVMAARGGGSILTISSGAAHNALEGWSHYCTSKAGVAMLTKCAHREGAAEGIRAIGLSPGTVATQMQREIKASGVNPVSQLDWSDHIPADWPAKCLLWMCGTEADEFLGEEISLRDEGIRRRIGVIA